MADEHPLIAHLKALQQRDDRGALAALRRGLGRPPGAVAEMHPHVARFLPPGRWNWYHECLYIVAALFGLHPDPPWSESGDMGDAFRRMAEAESQRLGEVPDSIEGRFVALLKCHRDDLADHLRHAVSLARSRDVGINWEKLLRDLRNWNSEQRWIQRRWARSFWGRADSTAEDSKHEQDRSPQAQAATMGE